MIVETGRLVLRRIEPGDAPFMLALLNEPSFIRNIGDRGVRTIDDATAYIASGPQASYDRFGFGLYLVSLKATAVPIGICGILKRDALPAPDIGFAFQPPYWSQGYAFESAAAIKDYARDTLGMPRLLAIVNPLNQSSIRLLERLGFTYESMTRIGADSHDVKLYSCALLG